MIIEKPQRPVVSWKDFFSDVSGVYIAAAVTAFLFAATGPIAIIVAVGISGGLTQAQIGSWIFAGCVVGGITTIGFSLAYRQPLAFAWTIPGTVLLESALDHFSFAEVIGAYWATAALIAVIGLSGWVRKAVDVIPLPIVLAMVAGIFLQFGLDVVLAFEHRPLLVAAMVLAYFAALILPVLHSRVPPLVLVLIVGVAAVLATSGFETTADVTQWFNLLAIAPPDISRQAIFELVIPLAITVLVLQNGQGFAVLMSAGHRPPVNVMTIACGIGSGVSALFGSVSACVTGPSNAVLTSSGEPHRQYTGAVVFGLLCIVFGFFAFAATWLVLKLPAEFIAVLAGLALLPVLQRAFAGAFSGPFAMSALVTFLITVSDISAWNIGAPLWALVTGIIVAIFLERDDYQECVKASAE